MRIELIVTKPNPLNIDPKDYKICIQFLLPELIRATDGSFVKEGIEFHELEPIDG